MYIHVHSSGQVFPPIFLHAVSICYIKTHRYTHVSNKIDFSVRNDKVTARALQGTGGRNDWRDKFSGVY